MPKIRFRILKGFAFVIGLLTLLAGTFAQSLEHVSLSYKTKQGWSPKVDQIDLGASLTVYLQSETAGQPDGVLFIDCKSPRSGRPEIRFRLGIPRSIFELTNPVATFFQLYYGSDTKTFDVGGRIELTERLALLSVEGVDTTVSAENINKLGVNDYQTVQTIFRRIAKSDSFRIHLAAGKREVEMRVSKDNLSDVDEAIMNSVVAYCLNHFP